MEDDGYACDDLPDEEEEADYCNGLEAKDEGSKGGDEEDEHVVCGVGEE